MHILGRNSRERKQYAGNICLVLFLAFLCTTIIVPVGAQTAYAVPVPSNSSLEVLRNEISINEAKTQLNIYMLLKPVTDSYFDTISVDFSGVVGEQLVTTAVYGSVYDSIYGDVYGYAVSLLYDIPEGSDVQYYNKPVFIEDENGILIQTEYVNLEVKPPADVDTANFSIIPNQNFFPVGQEVSMDIHLESPEMAKGVQFVLRYDPTCLEVIDADESVNGIQISPGVNLPTGNFSINKVEPEKGKITFAVAAVGANIAQSIDLAKVKFRLLRPGTTVVIFEQTEVINGSNDSLDCSADDLEIGIISGAGVEGKVTLEDRFDTNYSGVSITAEGTNYSTDTDNLGAYSLYMPGGAYNIWAEYPKHLSVKKAVTAIGGQTVTNVNFVLRSGDANGDNKVSVMDLVILAEEYPQNSSGDWASDFNGDGKVSLLDLAILAKNFLAVGDK
jgi:hypothetical protein